MKKTILFAVMMMAVCDVNAQLEVDTLGRVNIGNTLNYNPSSHLYIRGGNLDYGIRNYLTISQNNYFSSGIDNSITYNLTNDVTGIFSSTYGPNVTQDHRNIALRAFPRSKTTTAGLTIGVLGHLSALTPPSRGVGIFGSTTIHFDNSLINTRYAGFFNGLTKVNGDFIVTGNIQGTLLSPSNSSTGTTFVEELHELPSKSISGDLKSLTTCMFTHKISDKTRRALSGNNAPLNPTSDNYEDLSNEEFISMEEDWGRKSNYMEISMLEKQLLTKQHYGLNADQLKEVFPDLVYENEDGSKSINYVEMVPILVQAINELNAKIEVLEGGNAAKKAATRATGIGETGDNVTLLSLGQNKPNPFGTTTSIDVSIPESVQKAFIYVYDLQGKKVDQVDITARGKQTVQLNAATLTDGMYLYSLIADGKVVETRRMIVEK